MLNSLFVVAFAVSTVVTPPLFGQSIWLDHTQKKSIAIEILKPTLDGDDNTTFVSSAIFLSGRFTLSPNLLFVGELPFAHHGIDTDFRKHTETVIGNPYIGLEFRSPSSPVFAELGVRVPITPDDKGFASDMGIFADLDRFEAFTPDVLTVAGKVNFYRKSDRNIVFRIRSGPSLFINTRRDAGDDVELFVDYSAQIGLEGRRVSLIGGITGRLLVTEEDLNFGERSFHHLGAALSLNLVKVRPGIHFRVPIDDDFAEVVDFIFGVNLGIQFQ